MKTIVIDERDLITKACGGDLSSFSALVEMHQERVIRAAYSFVGNFEDARDLAQEAFVKAYENLNDFRQESRFYTWLYRIVANLSKDFLRKKKVRQNISFWFGRGEDEETDPVMNIEAKAKNADEELVNKELGGEIRGALDKLPLQQRAAFTLRYLEGLDIGEIAESMGITEGAVKATLWQACQKMRKNLGV